MAKKKPKIYGWIWHREDLSKEPPLVRLMNKKDRPKPIWNTKSAGDWFFGDWDNDGVRNPFDCAPRNPRKQGKAHEKEMGVPFETIEQMVREGKTVGDLKEFIRKKKEKLKKEDDY